MDRGLFNIIFLHVRARETMIHVNPGSLFHGRGFNWLDPEQNSDAFPLRKLFPIEMNTLLKSGARVAQCSD
jgi:hypothetical protein